MHQTIKYAIVIMQYTFYNSHMNVLSWHYSNKLYCADMYSEELLADFQLFQFCESS